MYSHTSMKYGKPLKIINAGEFYVTPRDEMIGTLLGSCVAVCLHDPVGRISGMNHFMLPGKMVSDNIYIGFGSKYGIYAIRRLLDSMLDSGARKKNLVAKIFGGGIVLDLVGRTLTIQEDNVRLARALLELEDIPIVESDVYGHFSRKVLMDASSGRVFLKKNKKIELLLGRAIRIRNHAGGGEER